MILSPATVVFLGKIASLASKGEMYVSSSAVMACAYLRMIKVGVRDREAGGAPSSGPLDSCNTEALAILAGLKGRVEVARHNESKAKLTQGSKSFWVSSVSSDETWQGWFGETWKECHAVTELETFRAALAAACKVAKNTTWKKSKLSSFPRVSLDGGEILATDGHRLAIHYAGVDAKASIHHDLGEAWGKMIAAYQKSEGTWWILTNDKVVALVFRHYGQEAIMMADQLTESECDKQPSVKKMRQIAAAQTGGVQVQLPPETGALCKLFETVAVWRNGAVLAWNKDANDNGGVGLIPQGEEPLATLDAKYLGMALPKGRNAPPAVLMVAGDVSSILESTIMAKKCPPPTLPSDCYLPKEDEALVA
jgi:hypothetical protein